jgi:hypothetical protein
MNLVKHAALSIVSFCFCAAIVGLTLPPANAQSETFTVHVAVKYYITNVRVPAASQTRREYAVRTDAIRVDGVTRGNRECVKQAINVEFFEWLKNEHPEDLAAMQGYFTILTSAHSTRQEALYGIDSAGTVPRDGPHKIYTEFAFSGITECSRELHQRFLDGPYKMGNEKAGS